MRSTTGFSLVELMVAVLIVSILAALALPAYRDYVTRGKLTEAYTVLSAQRVKMEQYYQDLRDYSNACQTGTVAPVPTGTYFVYACSNLSPTTYTVTATGNPAQGLSDQFVFTIDQSNNKASSGPTDWGGSPSCWIRAKGGQC